MTDKIFVKGAKENNLKNIDVEIPRDKLVVFTGLSGSGKSSLAFDTIFAEGQRRYIESLSSYARMFLGQMEKPDVEYIEGLSPAVSIDQKTTSKNPRSTVGTVTEIYDYLRLLYARVGTPHCPKCGREIEHQTVDQITDKIIESTVQSGDNKVIIMAPVARGRKGEYRKELEDFKKSGYVRVRVDGIDYTLDEDIVLDKNVKHDIAVTIDRIAVKEGSERRLTDSVEAALKLANGLVVVENAKKTTIYSTKYSCPDCDVSIEELEPRLFSFNNPYGACPECGGLGFRNEIDLKKIIVDENLGVGNGGLAAPSGWNLGSGDIVRSQLNALSKVLDFSLTTPIKDLPKWKLDAILYGVDERIPMDYNSRSFRGQFMTKYEGIVNNLMRRYRETTSDGVKYEIERYMVSVPCKTCGGKRLKKEALAVTVGGLNIAELSDMSVKKIDEFFGALVLDKQKTLIAERIIKEIRARLKFLVNVGLDYLTLSRSASTLSGGESQRIRLATQIGSGLTGVLYILDEPSIGLHQKDNERLLSSLKGLRDLGNTLIVVEHDEDTMRAADYLVDIGPGAGIHGGYIVAAGTPEEVAKNEKSITGQYLSGRKEIPVPKKTRPLTGKSLVIRGAKENNLKNIDVEIPLGVFTSVTGVSGSGKSSLINEILYKTLAVKLNRSRLVPGKCDCIEGIDQLDKVVNIDQSPIGRTPRSNPATYTGMFNDIRELFAQTPDARAKGFKAGRFSFNVDGGRCDACKGDGIVKIEMHFLPDIYVPCDVCGGKRYNRETLDVKFKDKNIYEVLDMTVEEGLKFFENIPNIYRKLETLYDVGLGYIKIGQPSTTLSGGEAQRIKLATELSKRSTGRTIYILDEPTTGLHSEDVKKLIKVLQKLTDAGNTVVVIEHNLDVIKCSDHIIDLGPEGGDGGGTVLCTGTPREVSKVPESFTGQYLKRYFPR